ncbi:MAG: hypothetical protein Q8P02_02935, partial [Candidatus Micrarchaeota archaeon]|nr:hypothetical protein [Candidatus Micrarchaeota archaeon]
LATLDDHGIIEPSAPEVDLEALRQKPMVQAAEKRLRDAKRSSVEEFLRGTKRLEMLPPARKRRRARRAKPNK